MRVLFVCTGNICRSTTAEVLTREFFPSIESDSCGVSDHIKNNIMAKQMRLSVGRLGFDFQPTRAKKITQDLLDWCDVAFYFQPNHLPKIKSRKLRGLEKLEPIYKIVGADKIFDPNFTTDPAVCDGVRDTIFICLKMFYGARGHKQQGDY